MGLGDFNFDDWFGQNYDPSDVASDLPLPTEGMFPGGGVPTGIYGSSPVLGLSAPGDASGSNSILQKLFGGSQPGQNLADLSSILGGFSSGEKDNRVTQGNFTQNYDRNMLAAQSARNQNESDAIRKLAQTNYIQSGGSNFKLPSSLNIGGTSYSVPDLGLGPKPISDAQKQGAATLQGQLLARLMPGGSYTPQPLDSYAKPGTAENIGNYGGVGTGIGGALANIFKPQ